MNLWRIFKILFALLIVAHAFVHLVVVPGMELDNGEPFGWSGESWLLSDSLDDDSLWNVGLAITALVIVFYVVAALGLLGVPGLKKVLLHSTVTATSMSLLLFFIIWDGIQPDPMAAIYGPITTAAVMPIVLLRKNIEVALAPKAKSETNLKT